MCMKGLNKIMHAQYNSKFYVSVGPTYKWCKIQENVKFGKHYSYGYLAGTILQLHKGAENTKCGNVKSGFCCIWHSCIVMVINVILSLECRGTNADIKFNRE